MIITTAWTTDMQPCADVTVPRMEDYAKKHGFTFKRAALVPDRTPQWSKVAALLDAVGQVTVGSGNDEVMWLDVDMLITNMNKEPPRARNGGITLGMDINGPNAGYMHIDPYYYPSKVVRILKEWELSEPRFKHHVSPEQTALVYLLAVYPRRYWRLIPQRRCNSYLYGLYNMEHKPGQWRKGDFILHVPALPIDKRAEILQQHTQYY